MGRNRSQIRGTFHGKIMLSLELYPRSTRRQQRTAPFSEFRGGRPLLRYKLLTKIFHTLLLKRINRIHTLCSFWSQRKGETLALAGFTYIDDTTLLLLFRFVKKLPSFNSRNRTALRPLLILRKTNYFAQKKIWQDTKKVTNNSWLIFFSGNSQRTPSNGLQCLLYFNGWMLCLPIYYWFFGTPLDYGPKIGRVFFLVMHAKNNFHNVDISYIIMNNDFTL